MKLVHWQIRDASTGIILPAEQARAAQAPGEAHAEGVRLNVNVLGEAVLGEAEAADRLTRVLDMMARPEVDYVSVKISAVVSQLSTYDHEGIASRASPSGCARSTGRPAPARQRTFVNLDMEEYRDLDLTVERSPPCSPSRSSPT